MKILKNFFECYFNQSADIEDLDKIIQEIKNPEDENYRIQLLTELHQIIQTKSYKLASKIIKKYGGRTCDLEITEKLIRFIYDRLLDRPATLDMKDFYNDYKIVYCPVCCPDPDLITSKIYKATICGKNTQIFFCKPCKLVWTTEDIRADNAQNYKTFMKALGLKGFWNELCNVDLL